jgi:hypothetical protein
MVATVPNLQLSLKQPRWVALVDAVNEDRGMPDDRTGSPDTPGSLPQEQVEDRPSVGIVKPEDYPKGDRADSKPDRPRNMGL